MNNTPDYHEGYSKGHHELPCEGMRSAEFQAGWLDGKTAIEYSNQASRYCDECGDSV
jgi:hypothetical protein